MSEFAFTVDRPAPGHGQHTDELLAEAGYSDDDIGSLRSAKVV